ncbi:MAG: HEAT repeat domain-containing protein, partial [Planctomycetota bacterium]
MTFAQQRIAFALLVALTGAVASAEEAITPAERAEALVARIRRGDPVARDEAVRELLELSEAESVRDGSGARPVHDVLRRALTDSDAEVRFRVRRVLADPEVRVEPLLVQLLEPQQTEAVRQTKKRLLDGSDRSVARAGLIRIARKAAQAGFNPLTSALNETWHPWGLEGGAQLKLERRFHIALDLLAEVASDEEVAPVCELLHEPLGASLADVVFVLAQRRAFARAWCRNALKAPDETTRENAAWALAEIGTAEDVPALDAALNDPEPRIRRAVVSAFAMIPLDAAACVQAAGRANDSDPRVATAALYVGALHGHKFVTEPARKILAAQPLLPADTRIHAMRALARFGDTDH